MDITLSLICPCNNKLYKSESSLKAHRKTQGHVFWEQSNEIMCKNKSFRN